jgi:ATPase subunit of ABC transporter with duplicated ATPase domains
LKCRTARKAYLPIPTVPGTVTVTNGSISKTFSGGSVTVSGASNILRGDNVEVGGANGEGKTVILATPPSVSKPIPPQGGVTGTGVVDEIKGIGGQAAEMGEAARRNPLRNGRRIHW